VLALAMVINYLANAQVVPAAAGNQLTVKRDACPPWQPGNSQTVALFVKAVEGEPAVIENCFRAKDRSAALKALRERRKARMASTGD
jgi:hypothetical protein